MKKLICWLLRGHKAMQKVVKGWWKPKERCGRCLGYFCKESLATVVGIHAMARLCVQCVTLVQIKEGDFTAYPIKVL